MTLPNRKEFASQGNYIERTWSYIWSEKFMSLSPWLLQYETKMINHERNQTQSWNYLSLHSEMPVTKNTLKASSIRIHLPSNKSKSTVISYYKYIQFLTIAPDGVVASLCSRLFRALPSTFFQVLLVVLLSSVESLCWKNLSHNLLFQFHLLCFHWLSC